MILKEEIKTLGELCEFVRGPFGGSLKKSSFKDQGYAVYEQQHAIYNQFDEVRYFVDDEKFEEMKRFELKYGDLIMSCSGTMGKVAVVPEGIKRGIINQALLKLTPKENLNIQYLRYWMHSPGFTEGLEKHTVGAAIKNVASVKVLKAIEIPAPKLSTQKQIVAILDQAFAAIDQAKANLERNIENAKELFQSKLNEVFSKKVEGWEEKRMDQLCGIKSKLVSPEELRYESFLHVGGGNIVANSGELVDLKTAHEEGLASGKYVFGSNVVLYNKIRPYLVKVARPDFMGLCSADMYPLSPNLEVITRDFLYFLLISKSFTGYAISGSARAGIPKVNRKHLFNYSISIPPIETQTELVESLNATRVLSRQLENQYQEKRKSLEDLKKSLLQKAFAGELTA